MYLQRLNSMSNYDLSAAKDLIQKKRYAEARSLLKNINHPTADKWLAKLNEIDPEDVPPSAKSNIPWLGIISIVAIICLTGMVVYQQIRLNNLSNFVGNLETSVATVRTSNVETTDSLSIRVTNLETDTSSLEIDVEDLINVVNSHATDLNTLSSNLRSVSAIADNANNYAHSHNSFSDTRLKTDITQINNPLERILSLNGVSFAWNSNAFPNLHLEDGRDYGVLAQEVKLVFPELVTIDTKSGMYRVDYQGLIPVLIESIRQQQQEIEKLWLALDEIE